MGKINITINTARNKSTNLRSTKVVLEVRSYEEFDLVEFLGEDFLCEYLYGNAHPEFAGKYKPYFEDENKVWTTAILESLFEYLIQEAGSLEDFFYKYNCGPFDMTFEVSVFLP